MFGIASFVEIEDEQLSQPAFELTHSQRSDRLNMSCAEMRFVDDRRLFVARVIARPPPSARGLDKLTYRLIRGLHMISKEVNKL